MAQGQDRAGLAGWLYCPGCRWVIPSPAESDLAAELGLQAGDRCPICAGRESPDPNARGVLRPATAEDLGRRAGG